MCMLEFISCNRVNKTNRSLRNLHETHGIVYITYQVLYQPWCTYLIDKVDFLFNGPVKHLLLHDEQHCSFNCQLYIPNHLESKKSYFTVFVVVFWDIFFIWRRSKHLSYEVNNKLWIEKQTIQINSFGLHVKTYIYHEWFYHRFENTIWMRFKSCMDNNLNL